MNFLDLNGNLMPVDPSSAKSAIAIERPNSPTLASVHSAYKDYQNQLSGVAYDQVVNELYDQELRTILLQQEMNQTSADKANAFTKEMQQTQYLYNRLARQSEYQDRISDLKAAGLNPLLALQNGSPSSFSVSAGSGASASVQKGEGASLGIDFLNVLSDVYGHTAKSLTDIYGHTVGLFGKLFKR